MDIIEIDSSGSEDDFDKTYKQENGLVSFLAKNNDLVSLGKIDSLDSEDFSEIMTNLRTNNEQIVMGSASSSSTTSTVKIPGASMGHSVRSNGDRMDEARPGYGSRVVDVEGTLFLAPDNQRRILPSSMMNYVSKPVIRWCSGSSGGSAVDPLEKKNGEVSHNGETNLTSYAVNRHDLHESVHNGIPRVGPLPSFSSINMSKGSLGVKGGSQTHQTGKLYSSTMPDLPHFVDCEAEIKSETHTKTNDRRVLPSSFDDGIATDTKILPAQFVQEKFNTFPEASVENTKKVQHIPRVGPLPSFSSINMSKGSLGVKGGSQTHQTGKLYSSTMPDLPHFVDCEAEIKSETHTKTNDRRVLPSSFDEGIATDTKILPAQFVQEKFNTFPEASVENTRKVQHIPRVGPLPSFSSINMPKGSLDVKGGSQTHQTGKLYSSTMPDLPHWVDCEAEISGETHTKTNDRRVLPSSFGEGIATDTKILHAQFVQEKFNTFPEASMENTRKVQHIPRVGPLPSFSSINMPKGSLDVKGGSQTHQTGKLYSSTMPDLPHWVDCEAEISSETHTKTNDRRVLPSSFDEGIATDTKILPAQFVQEKFNTFPEASMENTRKVQHIPRVGPLPSFSSINMSKGSLGVKGGSQTHQTGKLYSSTMPDLPHWVDCEAEISGETHTKTNDRRVLPSSFGEGIATDTKILHAQFVQEKFNTFPEASMENTRKVQHIPRVGPLPSFSSINMPKGSLDVKGGSQTHQTGKLYSSTMPDLPHWVDCEAEISGETHTKTNDRRVLPSSFGEGIATDTKILHAQFVQEKFNTFPEASMENTSDINNYDSLWIHGNTMTPRLLPSSFYGKSANSLQQHVSSNGQNLLPLGDNRRTEHDERLIYHEALQNLAQRKVEDDLPEGLLVVPLLKHQKIALAWMVRKEKSAHCSGGILADDQGLGKTISMIALIQKQLTQQLRFTSVDSDFPVKPELLNLEDDGVIDSDNTEQLTGNDGIKYEPVSTSFMHRCQNPRPRAGTLIVCPSSVLQQWARELDEKVPHQGKLSVLVYHGGGRTKDPSELAKYHVVLTTYSIVTNEVPKQSIADDYEDEQKKLERYGICPYFSSNRKRKQTSNKKNKVKKKGKGLKDSQLDLGSGPLAKVRWFRVILDEAQTIKNHRTRVATACCGLRAMRRWCLSGTPLQNAIDDLFSYFRFLKYEPYAVFSNFRASIKCLISKDASKGYRKLQAVLKAVLLRRTKGTLIDGEPILKLPPKSINLEKVEFSSEERDFYLELEADSLEQFEEYAAAGTLEQNYANILLMLLRLRQACDHPLLVKGFHSDTFRTDSLDEARQLPKEMLINLLNQLDGSLAMCGVCSDPPEDAVIAKCGHAFCYQCISEHLTGDDNWCPVTGCGGVVGSDSVFSRYTLKSCISDGFDDEASTSSSPDGESISHSGYISSKVRVTMDILRSICRPSSKTDDTLICGSGSITFNASPNSTQLNSNSNVPHKAIVFSQWTGMLDLLELSLNQSLIQYRRLDGRMSLPSRDKAVKDFNNDPEVAVILMSLKAGSLGLNMVAASHVILLDMWWNPTVEDQAIDRAHRIGQTRPVTVSRLAIKDTVEDRILALQEEKRRMISSVFGEEIRGNQTTRLTSDDLKYLFNRR